MDLGSNFASKLEPFILMSKSAKGAAAAKLVGDATSAPGVLVFSELLELPNIQELGKTEAHSKSLALLELFAYGTYETYMLNKDTYPALNAAQTTKLKHLSIVTLAAERRILPYNDLLRALDMPNVRELEDLIIDAIYLDILRGRLDQKASQLEVEYTMGRDLAPGAIDAVLAALRDWASTTAAVLQTLDAKLTAVASQTAARKADLAAHDEALQSVLKEVAKEKGGNRRAGGSGSGGMPYDPMEVDESGSTAGVNMGVLMNTLRGLEGQENTRGKGRKTAPEAAKPVRKRNRF